MEEITDEMIVKCLEFIQGRGGGVSRYSFDRYITSNIRVKESFTIVPKKLVDEGLINIMRNEKGIMVTLTSMGADKIQSDLK